jgi:hypothetical protein
MEAVNQESTPKRRIEAWAAECNVTLRAEFVPFSKSRNAKPAKGEKPWRSLNWRVALMRTDPAKANYNEEQKAIERGERDLIPPFEYSQGEGHCPSYSQRRTHEVETKIAFECETGLRASVNLDSFGNARRHSAIRAPLLPDLADVLASLASDARVIEEGPFEEWASSLGYDPDSRKAEAIYRACIDTATALIRAFGMDGLKALQDAAEGY